MLLLRVMIESRIRYEGESAGLATLLDDLGFRKCATRRGSYGNVYHTFFYFDSMRSACGVYVHYVPPVTPSSVQLHPDGAGLVVCRTSFGGVLHDWGVYDEVARVIREKRQRALLTGRPSPSEGSRRPMSRRL